MWNKQFLMATLNLMALAAATYLAPHLVGVGPDDWGTTLIGAGVAALGGLCLSVIMALAPLGGKGVPMLTEMPKPKESVTPTD